MTVIMIIACLFGCVGVALEEYSNTFKFKWVKGYEDKYNRIKTASLICGCVCVVLILAGCLW